MNKILSLCIVIVAVGVWICLSVCSPWVLGDNNSFLSNFVNHEFLNVLGLIVAITLASTANLHLQFNHMEDSINREFLMGTRGAVRRSSFFLVAAFAAAIILVVVKPLLPSTPLAMSLVNGFGLLILLSNLLVLIDITVLVFKIPPMFKIKEEISSEERKTTEP